MIERIVVPLDGSMTAETILTQVCRVLDRKDSELILLRAVDLTPIKTAMMDAEAALGAAREYLQGQKEKLERGGVKVRIIARLGTPAGAILETVKEQHATMVALATHGASGVSRLLLGSVTEEVLRQSPVPVLVIRPFWSYEVQLPRGSEHPPVRTLLVPVDGTDRSTVSLPGIIELARLFDMRILLLRVLEANKRRPVLAEEHAKALKQLKALARTVEKAGVEAVTLVDVGDPARQILDSIRARGVDLIAMTTHGRSGLKRLVAGSVTERVLRSATVPLLVTCSPERSQETGFTPVPEERQWA
ncbi:MAG TPA: universal stress protein [Planctomycetota bacterium]|nr:universal stress protein [Planctomycetota bacterium]